MFDQIRRAFLHGGKHDARARRLVTLLVGDGMGCIG